MERSLQTIAGAQLKQANTGEYEAPCRDGEYNNKSDLCAQWYAARAARDAADWAAWGFWLGLAGTLGLIYNLYYTRKAVLAAEDATKDADRALELAERNANAAVKATEAMERQNNIAVEAQRPWVQVKFYAKRILVTQDEVNIGYTIELTNIGKTAARNFQLVENHFFEEGPREALEKWKKVRPPPRNDSESIILPGEVITYDRDTIYTNVKWRTHEEFEMTRFILAVGAYYLGDEKEKNLVTIRTFILSQPDIQSRGMMKVLWRDLKDEFTGDRVKCNVGPYPETI